MIKRNKFVSLFTLSSMVFYIGCSKTNDQSAGNEPYLTNTVMNFGSVGRNNINTVSYNNLNEFIDLLKVYEEIESKDEYISFLEKNYKAKFLKDGDSRITYSSHKVADADKPGNIKELQKNYGIEISEIKLTSELKGQPNYKFMIESASSEFGNEAILEKKQLEGKYFFEDLNSLEKFLTNDSLYHLKNKDLLSTLTSVLRGKSTKIVEGITTQDSSSAIVIDGFDDIATALESSGLSKKIVFSTQALGLYPAFLFFVASGVEGAAAQRQEGKDDYKSRLQDAYIQEIELENTIKDLLSKKQPIPNEIHEQSEKNLTFKKNLLIKISEFLKKNKNSELKVLPDEIIHFIKNESPNFKETSVSAEHKDTVQKLVDGIKNSPEIELMNLVEKLSKYKADKKDLLSSYYETKFSKALTEGGLKAMFYGMAAFEGRAGSKLYNLLSSNPSDNIDSFANLLGGLGDAYLAAGQAQMVLAGIQKLYLGSSDVKKYNDWVKLLENSDLFNVKNSDSGSELQNAKGMLTHLVKTLRKTSIVEVLGNTSLTAGQFAMLVGGPFGMASAPLTLVGAGATIGGVAITQIVEKFTELKYGFADAQEGSVEYEIINGKYDNAKDNNLDKIVKRVDDLATLSKERSLIRVWEKIYSQIQKNPNIKNNDLKNKLKKKFSEIENDYHQYYLEALNNIFPENNIITTNKSYQIMDNARQFWSAANSNKDSQLLYLNFKLSHLVHLKEQVSLKIQNHLNSSGSQQSENKTLNDFNLDGFNTLKNLSNYSDPEVFKIVSNILDSFESFGLEEQLGNKIMSKLLKEDGAIWQGIDTSSKKMKAKKGEINKYLTYEKIGFEDQPVQSSALAGVKSIFSIFKERFLPYSMKKQQIQKNGIIKEEIIYKLELNQLKNDLANYNQQDQKSKDVLIDLSRKLFFNNNEGNGISNSFGKNPQNVAEKINNNGLGKKVRSDALSPLLGNAIPLVELYDEMNNMESINGESIENKDTKIRKAKRFIDKKLNRIKNRLSSIDLTYIRNRFSSMDQKFQTNLKSKFDSVKKDNNIPENFYPNIIDLDSNSNKIEFRNPHDINDVKIVDVSPDLYNKFSKFNRNLVQHLSDHRIATHKNTLDTGEGYSGLSKAFAIQALMMHFSRHNHSQEDDNSTLGKIIESYDNINVAQMAIGVADEGKYLIKTVNGLNSSHLKYNPTKYSIGGKIVKGVGILDIFLSGAAVGLDVAALTNSETRSQKIIHGTQLVVDGAGLGTAVAGVATGSLAVGYMAVPLAGIGIGVTGIASNIAGHIQNFENVAKYLNQYAFTYNNNYGRSYFQKIGNTGAGNNIPYFDFSYLSNGKVNLDVITELDLTNSDINTGEHFIKLKRSSSYISKANEMKRNLNNLREDYQSHASKDSDRPYPFVSRYKLYNTNFDFNKSNFISIRELLNVSDSYQITTLSHVDETERQTYINNKILPQIVLPMTPETFYSYEFSLVTTSFTQNWSWTGEDFRVARELHYRPDFSFSYHYWSVGPQEQGITELYSRAKDTDIKIKLGSHKTTLITPKSIDEWKNKITYHLEGLNGGTHQIFAREGFKYDVTGNNNDNFIFDVSEISDQDLNYISDINSVTIGGVEFKFDSNKFPKEIKFINKNKECYINYNPNLKNYSCMPR